MSGHVPHVYDKAKYHAESVDGAGLPDSHASNHIVPVLRWLIENDMMSEAFDSEGNEPLARYRAGGMSIHDLLDWWDGCLTGDMLSDRGNSFAMAYFDYGEGRYIHDYIEALQGRFPSEFHVPYTEDGYAKLKAIIDRRYRHWLARAERPWWKFWR